MERVAFSMQIAGEADLPGIFSEPLPEVVQALREYDNANLLASNLPDRDVGAVARDLS